MEIFHPIRLEGAAAYELPEVTKAYDARPSYPSEAIDYMLDHVLPQPDGDMLPKILDAGTGNGLVTEGILKSDRAAEIVALDQSEGMTDAFRQRIDRPIPLVRATFNTMPFADNSFDVVIFGTALHWGDPDCLPAELYRVLRPGGSVASIGNAQPFNSEFTKIILELPTSQVFGANPMTMGGVVELGTNFSFELSRNFSNNVEMTPDMVNTFLMSVDPFQTAPPEQQRAAWDKVGDYVRRHAADGLVPVPFDTQVRIARVKK